MTTPDPHLSALLYEALAAPVGLLCSASPDFDRARAKLYATRRALADPALEALQFRASPWPEEGNLVICKATVEIASKAEIVSNVS